MYHMLYDFWFIFIPFPAPSAPFQQFPGACLLLQMLLFNEVIKLPLSSQGSVCLLIAGVSRACLENIASIRPRLRLQTPGLRPFCICTHSHQPDSTGQHTHCILGDDLDKGKMPGKRQKQTAWPQTGSSHVPSLFKIKPQACHKNSRCPFPRVS